MRHFATIAVAFVLLAVAGAAAGADGDPFLKSCHSSSGASPCTALGPPFSAFDVEVDADGRHLYAAVGDAGGGFNGVRIFDVGAGGSLTARAGAAHTTAEPPQDLDLSADGRNLYLAAGAQLVVLSRDPASGALAHAQTVSAPSRFDSLAVAPTPSSVYARGPNHLTVFDRNLTTGLLTQKLGLAGCLSEETVLPCNLAAVGLGGTALETVVSPDGLHVYTTNQIPGGIAVFNRAPDGTLSQANGTNGGCISVGGTSGSIGGVECVAGPPTLAEALAANIDAQGAHVIVSGNRGRTVFRRDASVVRLTQTDCLDEAGGAGPPAGCHEVKGAAGTDAVVTPDGIHVALNAQELGISFFTIDRAAGKLAQRATRPCFSAAASPPCAQAPGLMGGAGGVTANGLYVFTASRGGSVAAFERDVAPQCRNKSISLRRRVPVWVPLSCTDANGDQVMLAVAAPPAFGEIGRLDQAKDRVRYIPDATRKGKDPFRYRGTARGARGTPATVTVNVLARPAKADRKPPNTRITTGPPKLTRSRTVRFKFRSTERGSEFQCKPDWRKKWASCSSPKSYSRLRPGRHSFQVRAIDRAGNVDRSPAKRTWSVSRR